VGYSNQSDSTLITRLFGAELFDLLEGNYLMCSCLRSNAICYVCYFLGEKGPKFFIYEEKFIGLKERRFKIISLWYKPWNTILKNIHNYYFVMTYLIALTADGINSERIPLIFYLSLRTKILKMYL